MAWIESHQSLRQHRKVLKAVEILGMDRHKLLGHLHCLWWWALDNADAEGKLPAGTTVEILAIGAEVPKRSADKFIRALITAGFIKWENIDGLARFCLHDWHDYAGKLMEKRSLSLEQKRLGGKNRMAYLSENEKIRLAKSGASARWHAQNASGDASTHLAEMPATVPNRTQPNSTVPGNTPLPPSGETGHAKSETVQKQLFEQTETVERVGKKSRPRESYASKSQELARYFETFWQAYPRKEARQDAVKAFMATVTAAAQKDPGTVGQLMAEIMSSLEKKSKSLAWTKDGGRYIPLAATWLNGRRWEDEVREGGDNAGPGQRRGLSIPERYTRPDELRTVADGT